MPGVLCPSCLCTQRGSVLGGCSHLSLPAGTSPPSALAVCAAWDQFPHTAFPCADFSDAGIALCVVVSCPVQRGASARCPHPTLLPLLPGKCVRSLNSGSVSDRNFSSSGWRKNWFWVISFISLYGRGSRLRDDGSWSKATRLTSGGRRFSFRPSFSEARALCIVFTSFPIHCFC